MKIIIETPYYIKSEAKKRIKDDIIYDLNTDGVVILPYGFRATVIGFEEEYIEVYFKQNEMEDEE